MARTPRTFLDVAVDDYIRARTNGTLTEYDIEKIADALNTDREEREEAAARASVADQIAYEQTKKSNEVATFRRKNGNPLQQAITQLLTPREQTFEEILAEAEAAEEAERNRPWEGAMQACKHMS